MLPKSTLSENLFILILKIYSIISRNMRSWIDLTSPHIIKAPLFILAP